MSYLAESRRCDGAEVSKNDEFVVADEWCISAHLRVFKLLSTVRDRRHEAHRLLRFRRPQRRSFIVSSS